jgi:hypothetical protein
MKVFLGWSGDTSHKVALNLHSWLPQVIQAVKPWMSSEDIAKGARWSAEIASELQASNFGIICVTRENAKSPWINFEGGALSREIDKGFVSPFLFNMKRSELQGPLAQFQNTLNEGTEIFRLLSDINNRQENGSRLGEASLKTAFEMWWPHLKEALARIEQEDSGDPPPEIRSTNVMLEDLLELTMGLQREMRAQSDRQANMSDVSRVQNEVILRDWLSKHQLASYKMGKEALAAERQEMLEALERIQGKLSAIEPAISPPPKPPE